MTKTIEVYKVVNGQLHAIHKEKQQQQQYNNVGGICQLLFPTLKKNLRFWLIEGRPVGVMCRIAANNRPGQANDDGFSAVVCSL
ncbi:hypothetical protein T4D_10344 [Trichinella pseudospiralis]|uniref:Uncharacterized protein n=1 Tax=Trichinella pseudospiralis TaxID=6337 RepID=A0A0V1G106_TRIPS|nr:hypothetical protein T4D_10344 [Trichinella pseudospiralis]